MSIKIWPHAIARINLLLCLGVVSLPAIAAAETKTASLGSVQATFSYNQKDYCLENLRLKIVRAGETLLDQPLPNGPADPGACRLSDLRVVNLDNQAEPEVLVDLYTGGAHCCNYSLIYAYSPTAKQYQPLNHFWGNPGYRLVDLDKNGELEFQSADDRFAYEFAPYAASGLPLQVWRYRQGQMVDVTRQYPGAIYNNAYQNWQAVQTAQQQCDPAAWGTCGEGVLAAYLADKYLLGQGQDGWRRVKAVYQGKGCEAAGDCGGRQRYFTHLQQFLQQTGYTSAR